MKKKYIVIEEMKLQLEKLKEKKKSKKDELKESILKIGKL
jgi:hypothetical protein